MSTVNTPDGRTLYPYSHARISFVATFDGEERTGFTFALNHDADKAASEMEARGARCLVGRTAVIESDDEAGFPDFRAWVNAMDNCDRARRVGSHIVVLHAR
jgi:hypothetical protein